ncbi:subtype B tannase [Lactiplantibacillus modestisalitolerans]|uniref:Subtype B tannase n=1 Tax=Lactiplantibacillus modestisalitolerans TaxID=1457219 RepID=A0ABV5WRM9_9LACO|nr:subtype B tannase [Lactiplantibacillus modestisalitolerans]
MAILDFHSRWFQLETVSFNGQPFQYYAANDISYVTHPVAAIQRLNVFVPTAYMQANGTVNGYTAATAPIFMPNTVGGYMPGPADSPQKSDWPSNARTIIGALKRGYVVVSAGLRGRTTTTDGQEAGHAPAFIVDLKAAIRYVRYNAAILPGNAARIITNGTSAGGATAALAGAAGNVQDYEPFLKAIGAADVPDDVYAVSAYCPIHNLAHADMAYEWQFNGINDWHRFRITPLAVGQRPKMTPITGNLSTAQQAASTALKSQFIAYLNDLHLTGPAGKPLTLDATGKGAFADEIARLIQQSAQRAYDQGVDVHKYAGIQTMAGSVTAVDLPSYVRSLTRMKAVPAFDTFDLSSPENNLFGDETVPAKHFTAFSQAHDTANGTQAADHLVALTDPVSQLQAAQATVAPYWRIRHGAADRDTSFAIPLILASLLRQQGRSVDFALPWDTPHSGDYDLNDLFDWIDRVVAR